MPVRPTWSPNLAPFVPAFADGTTGGTGGTVSDGGQPGSLTFTLATSGHSDPSDGCWISWPARDLLGRRLPDLPTGLTASAGLDRLACGSIRWTASSTPTAGNGVKVAAAVVLTPDAASVMGSSSRMFPLIHEFNSSFQASVGQWNNNNWSDTSGFGSGTQGTRIHGDALWDLGGPVARLLDGPQEMPTSRGAAVDLELDSSFDGFQRRLIVLAWREGSSTGSEVVTIEDLAASLYMLETA